MENTHKNRGKLLLTRSRLMLISVLVLVTWFIPVFSSQSSLIQFRLKDQFDREYTDQDFWGRTVILVGSDREGSQFNEEWSKALYDSLVKYQYRDSVVFLPVANVQGVPFFLKGMVKGKFPRDKQRWILLDWQGIFAGAYQFVPGHSNIIVVGSRGNLIHQCAVRELDDEILNKCLERIFTLFDIPRVNQPDMKR